MSDDANSKHGDITLTADEVQVLHVGFMAAYGLCHAIKSGQESAKTIETVASMVWNGWHMLSAKVAQAEGDNDD